MLDPLAPDTTSCGKVATLLEPSWPVDVAPDWKMSPMPWHSLDITDPLPPKPMTLDKCSCKSPELSIVVAVSNDLSKVRPLVPWVSGMPSTANRFMAPSPIERMSGLALSAVHFALASSSDMPSHCLCQATNWRIVSHMTRHMSLICTN